MTNSSLHDTPSSGRASRSAIRSTTQHSKEFKTKTLFGGVCRAKSNILSINQTLFIQGLTIVYAYYDLGLMSSTVPFLRISKPSSFTLTLAPTTADETWADRD